VDCLDTDILVALLKGDPEATAFIEKLEGKGEKIKTSDVSAYELVKGAHISSKPEDNLKIVGGLLSILTVLTLNRNSFEFAARIHRDLRKAGKIIGELDILIAGICHCNDEALVSRDGHFREIGKVLNLMSW
jgi:predicted nucleic acid-binding protein